MSDYEPEPGPIEVRWRRAAWRLWFAGGITAITAIVVDRFALTMVSVGIYGVAFGCQLAQGRHMNRRHAANKAHFDRRTTEALSSFREHIRDHGYDVPDEVTNQDLERAMVYVGLGYPLYADGEVSGSCEAVAIVAPAAAKTREVAERSGPAPKRWMKKQYHGIVT